MTEAGVCQGAVGGVWDVGAPASVAVPSSRSGDVGEPASVAVPSSRPADTGTSGTSGTGAAPITEAAVFPPSLRVCSSCLRQAFRGVFSWCCPVPTPCCWSAPPCPASSAGGLVVLVCFQTTQEEPV